MYIITRKEVENMKNMEKYVYSEKQYLECVKRLFFNTKHLIIKLYTPKYFKEKIYGKKNLVDFAFIEDFNKYVVVLHK